MSPAVQEDHSGGPDRLTPANPAHDDTFLLGLSSILDPLRARGASQSEIDEVTERAHAFYLQSSNSSTAASNHTNDVSCTSSTSDSPAQPLTKTEESGAAAQSRHNPPYPLSFASLASLIASGAPIPGIREIPDKLAEGLPSISKLDTGRVRKPWEALEGSVPEQFELEQHKLDLTYSSE